MAQVEKIGGKNGTRGKKIGEKMAQVGKKKIRKMAQVEFKFELLPIFI